MFDFIIFFLFNNSNQSINDQNAYSHELCKEYVKILKTNLNDSEPTNMQILKIFVKGIYVDHVDMSQISNIEEYIEKLAISRVKGGIWGDSTTTKYLLQLIIHHIYIWTISKQPIVITKFEYLIENIISNPSKVLNIVYEYNHYCLMLSITSNQNVPSPPLPRHINTSPTCRSSHGFGSTSKPSLKKRKFSSCLLNSF